jgi:hypothetical protein
LSTTGAKDANNASFSVGGNWTVSGTATFTEGAGTITLNGTGAQTLSNASGETFNNLTINNTSTSDISFNNNVTVSSVLTMTDGNVNLNSNTLTLSSAAAGALVHGLTSASGWMYGGSIVRSRPASTLITVGTAHSLFPLGSSGDWRPFFAGQTSNANSAGTITVSHTNATTTSDVSFAESIVRRHDSYWTVATSGITAGPTYDLRAGGTTFGTIEAGAADLRMSTSTSVVGTHATGSGGPTDWRVNRTGVVVADLANNFHVASTDAVNSPLPIELISFKGEVVEEAVQLIWVTASELSNDFFIVERSATGEVFLSIGQVNGSGTTNQGHTYNLMDFKPISGTAYYRLKQTDFDGTFTYSNIISVTYEGPSSSFINVYPNPSNGDEVTIEIKGLKNNATIPVIIYDQLGRQRTTLTLDIDKNSGTAQKRFTFKGELPEGVYIVKAGPSQLLVKRFIVTRK